MRPRCIVLASLHLVLPALVVLAGAWFARCRTPITYWADPDYAYLLNALSLAEGAAPSHTQHPGTTAQEMGAVVLRLAHAFRPAGFAHSQYPSATGTSRGGTTLKRGGGGFVSRKTAIPKRAAMPFGSETV